MTLYKYLVLDNPTYANGRSAYLADWVYPGAFVYADPDAEPDSDGDRFVFQREQSSPVPCNYVSANSLRRIGYPGAPDGAFPPLGGWDDDDADDDSDDAEGLSAEECASVDRAMASVRTALVFSLKTRAAVAAMNAELVRFS